MEKKEHGGQIPGSMGQNDPSISTAEMISKETGVSPRTVKRNAQFSQAVDKLSPEEKAEVLAGRSGKTKQDVTK